MNRKMNTKPSRVLWLFLLPILVPVLVFAFQRLNFTKITFYSGAATTLDGKNIDPDAMIQSSIHRMVEPSQSSRFDVIEMRNGDGLAITYFRKTKELHYGFFDKHPRYVAYDVTPAEIAAVAKAGGSFKDFKRYHFYPEAGR